MNPLLRDFYGHQVWADAEHWRTIEVHAPSAQDAAIKNRLHHIHLVQHGFLWAVGDRRTGFTFTKASDFASLPDLKCYAREYHDLVASFLEDVTDSRLEERIDIPWFTDPPLSITVTEALTQCAMHSQHHRGQNATRLRELGREPPGTDLIVWYWKNRPTPVWT